MGTEGREDLFNNPNKEEKQKGNSDIEDAFNRESCIFFLSRFSRSDLLRKMSESDKEKILEVVEEKLTWLRENGDDAAAEELKTQKKELERCRSRSSLVSTSRRGRSPLPRNTN